MRQANQRKKGPIKPPLITPALDPSEGDGSTPNGMRAPDRRQKPSDLAQVGSMRLRACLSFPTRCGGNGMLISDLNVEEEISCTSSLLL